MIQKKRIFSIVLIAFKWGLNVGVFKTAIHGKTVWCSFESFEQCIF